MSALLNVLNTLFFFYFQVAKWLMLVWVKRCTCYAKDMENLLVMIFAIIAFINSIFHVAWFYSDDSFLVILDSPAGMSSDVWIYVQENMAKLTTVSINTNLK